MPDIPAASQCPRCRLSFDPYSKDIDDARGAIEHWQKSHTCTPWREKRRRARVSLVGRLFLWLLDQAGLHTGEWCRSFGGLEDGRPRVCGKPRWHWDSHAYEFLDDLMATAGTVLDGRPERPADRPRGSQ